MIMGSRGGTGEEPLELQLELSRKWYSQLCVYVLLWSGGYFEFE